MIDMFGRRVYSASVADGTMRIVPNVAAGMYIVRVYRDAALIRSIPVVNIGR